jgi:ABC-2 type transport system permease protein
MLRLTRVELRRLFARRLTFLVLLGALVITGLLLFATYQQAKPLSGPELTAQRVQFEQARKEFQVHGAEQVQQCLTEQAKAREVDPKATFQCDQLAPNPDTWGKPVAKFSAMMPPVLQAGSYLAAFLAFLIGAGFVAAEFSSGSMGNWLTFEPRRMRVFSSKLAAVSLGLLPATVTLLGVLTAGVWLIVGHFGATTLTTAKVWGDLGTMAGRSVLLAFAAAMAGAAMGALLRHTAAVIGIAMGYLVIVEGVFGQALQSAQPWLLKGNFDGWLLHGTTYFTNVCTTDKQGNYSCSGVEKLLSFGHSSAYLGVLSVLLVVLAALVFRRRDVA